MQKSNPKKPIFKEQSQQMPGLENRMDPLPEFDDHSPGSDRLLNKKCIITGGDSGIGRAVAIAFARQGADVAIIHHGSEKQDAEFTADYIHKNFKRKCLTVAADIAHEKNCKTAVNQIVKSFEKVDVLVNNAAVQYPAADLTQISSEKLIETFSVNILAMFWITSAVLPFMQKGGCIINTTSVTAYRGSAGLIDYSATKGAIVSFTRSLSSNLIEKGIRVNGVAPGPVWTPLVPASFPPDEVAKFGTDSPMKRPAQPREVAPAYVFLASQDANFISGQIIHVNGGEIVNG
ncbi:MAG TPA: SDR family oxidoreductase [Prolixibacteraceae bacterium]|jgi:NAD(P)-dependent dehydrogenase (short-subunit alcohol dehydrogenase family)